MPEEKKQKLKDHQKKKKNRETKEPKQIVL